MASSDDSGSLGIPEIDAAVSKIKKGDTLAESGERELAAGKYREAISQLKSVLQRNEGRVREIAERFLRTAYQHGQRLIDKDPVSDSRDLDEIVEKIDASELSQSECSDVGQKSKQEDSQRSPYRAVRERIAEGDRLRREDEYDAAIECYEEAKQIIDEQLSDYRGKTLKTEVDINLRKARREKPPEVNDTLKQIQRDVRERIAEGDRLRRGNEYDAAIDCYEEANQIIDEQLSEYSGKTLKTEVDINLRKARREKRLAVQRVKELDNEIQQLNHNLLARHGFELPYRHAAIDSDTVNEPPEVVYSPPLNLDVVDKIAAYYRELGSFERQLASVATETGQPTAVTELLGDILSMRHQGVQMDPEGERDVVGAAENVLDGYLVLIRKGDDDGISELERRLNLIRADIDGDATSVDSTDLDHRLNDVESWTGERARRIDLQSQANDLRNRWPRTAGEHLDLDIDVVEHLTGSDSGEPSLSQFESGLETAERIVALAIRVKTVREEYRTPVVNRLPETFGQHLEAGDLSDARLDRLEKTLDGIETALDANRQYPSYPFERVVEYMCTELERESFDMDTDEVINLVEDSADVLDFLGRVDGPHPSVQPDEWQETIQTGLENVSPELVRPLASLVDRMGETLWERSHLHQYEWKEFERLVEALFESMGYETRATQKTRDQGVDIWAHHQGDRVAIEVKQRRDASESIGRPPLQKLASHIAKGDADRAIFVTSGEFGKTAKEYSKDFGDGMLLVDGTKLVQMLTESEHPPPLTD